MFATLLLSPILYIREMSGFEPRELFLKIVIKVKKSSYILKFFTVSGAFKLSFFATLSEAMVSVLISEFVWTSTDTYRATVML